MDDAMDYRAKIIGAIVSTEKQLEETAENESIASGPRGRRHSLESIQSVSAVNDSENLADVDKLKYLRGFLEEPARSVIAGIPTTDSSYETAVGLLKSRYANPAVIQRAHINQLLNLAPVFNEKNTARLRSFHDHIQTHFRGLEALSVDTITYSSVIVPVLIEKLPEGIRLGMLRDVGKSHLDWNLEEMLGVLSKELEIRECHFQLSRNPNGQGRPEDTRRSRQESNPGRTTMGTANALFAGKKEKKRCAYCSQEHVHEDSSIVATVDDLEHNEERKLGLEVHKLWDLDTLGIRPQNEVHEKVIDNISFTGGRYSVGLPWKAGHRPLPSNYLNSLARLNSQMKRLEKETGVLEKYNGIIMEQLQMGIIEMVPELDMAEKVHYLSHTTVIRDEAETTKVRIVYDASCRDRKFGVSLNDCLHAGLPLTPLIFDILLRFQEGKVALVGDIEKAFLNIEIDSEDRDCLRFLWFDNVMADKPKIVTYRFNRVVFGVNSSPFLLNAVLKYHIETFKQLDPLFVQQVAWSFYVDDFVVSVKDCDVSFALYEKVKNRLDEGGFKLRKWKTNDSDLKNRISEGEKHDNSGTEVTKKQSEESYGKESFGSAKKGETKVLGLNWDSQQDSLEFELAKVAVSDMPQKVTKRGILSNLAMIFDPTGIASPLCVKAKIIFQELCKQNLGWDDPVPEEQQRRWKAWVSELNEVKSITIARFMFYEGEGEMLDCQSHGFGDASQKGYCAAIYLVYKTNSGPMGHVAGLSNPADLGSRGTTASQLVHSELWWRGPAWLIEGEESWPAELRLEDTSGIAVERKITVVADMIAEEDEGPSQVIDASRLNNLNTLLRVTALTYRFIDNLKAKKAKQEIKVNNLEVNDKKRAELYWIREAQKQLTREEHCKKTKVSLGIEEREGTLNCRGRLEHSDLDIEARFPIILPKNHKFTDLIVVNSHLKTHHGSVKTTLAEVRTRFWIVKGRQYVKKLLRGCFICKKFEGKAYRPGQTSALPEFRVTQALPLSREGVDFADPFFVKQTSGEMSKAYLALFSCCVTRALHSELVSDLNASTFINCLRRFCARRGTPHLIVSDNAKTFKATAKSLKEVSKESTVQEFLLSRRIQGKFNL
eukprot:gene6437-biopygen4765